MSRESEVKKGDLVEWEGKTCRVLRRRQVTGLAMFRVSDDEDCLATLDGEFLGWVPENEVTRIDGETGDR